MQYLWFFVTLHHPSEGKPVRPRIALATHRDVINKLFSAGPSNQQNEFEPEPRTKDVGIQCGKYFTVCVHAVAICKFEYRI